MVSCSGEWKTQQKEEDFYFFTAKNEMSSKKCNFAATFPFLKSCYRNQNKVELIGLHLATVLQEQGKLEKRCWFWKILSQNSSLLHIFRYSLFYIPFKGNLRKSKVFLGGWGGGGVPLYRLFSLTRVLGRFANKAHTD